MKAQDSTRSLHLVFGMTGLEEASRGRPSPRPGAGTAAGHLLHRRGADCPASLCTSRGRKEREMGLPAGGKGW